jgi:hypothetical protein
VDVIMDRLQIRCDNRSAGEWLDQASRSGQMASQFTRHSHLNSSFAALARDARSRAIDTPAVSAQALEDYDWSRLRRTAPKASRPSDIDYFRGRAAKELTAAGNATDKRARRVHFKMAERYQALISKAEIDEPAGLQDVAS